MTEQQFLDLIDQHQRIIYKICRLYRDTAEDREDLFQEIVYQLWKATPSFRKESKMSSWIYRIAINTAIVAFRKKRPAIELAASMPDIAEETKNEEIEWRKELLFAALKKLDETERALIALYLEELPYKEISEVMGISETNVGVRLSRIRDKIQKIIINN